MMVSSGKILTKNRFPQHWYCDITFRKRLDEGKSERHNGTALLEFASADTVAGLVEWARPVPPYAQQASSSKPAPTKYQLISPLGKNESLRQACGSLPSFGGLQEKHTFLYMKSHLRQG